MTEMRITHDLAEVHPSARAHVTIGIFDGVHRGHRRLLNRMITAAHTDGHIAAAITFDPHPANVLGYEPLPMLTTISERARLMDALGLDWLVVLPFTSEMAQTPAEEFVHSLIQHLHLAALWGGPDLAFGRDRQGDIPFLRRMGEERDFSVYVVEPVVWDGSTVNSSRIRAALAAGDVAQAAGCLGRPYRLTGTVVHGRGLGRRIGIPTANLELPPYRLVPCRGVYACWASLAGDIYPAVTNVGIRPTFAGQSLVTEVHLLDFEADLYGQRLALDFIARLRDERSFPTLNTLVEQIQADIAQSRTVLASLRSPE